MDLSKTRFAAVKCAKCGKIVSKVYNKLVEGFVGGLCSRCVADYVGPMIIRVQGIVGPVSKFLVDNKILKEGDKMPLNVRLYSALVRAKEYKEEVKGGDGTSPS
jgi:hypothetical protein